MENKKLLKFLLNDLTELDELVAENGDGDFDDLEMEFLQTRVGGAKRMIQILLERENSASPKVSSLPENIVHEEIEKVSEPVKVVEEKVTESEKITTEPKEEPQKEEEIVSESPSEIKEEVVQKEDVVKIEKDLQENIHAEIQSEPIIESEKEVELEENKIEEDSGVRLGDKFSKEKSVNDLVDVGSSKLEHKLSNRPVSSIKTAIGINDRFQFIRELFEGNAEAFSKAVSELDAKTNINEAVEYMQINFKWKKNETSLKFVHLVKRRFSNE